MDQFHFDPIIHHRLLIASYGTIHTARNHRNDFVEISHFEHIPAF